MSHNISYLTFSWAETTCIAGSCSLTGSDEETGSHGQGEKLAFGRYFGGETVLAVAVGVVGSIYAQYIGSTKIMLNKA